MEPVTMLTKVVILLACLYVVRAGVFTVNVYEDENNDVPSEDSVDKSVRSCVNSQCNSFCRALGFARGVCISSTVCRCSGRLAKANDKDASLDNVNQEVENVYDGAETLDRSVRSCVNSQCNSVCRALGFARGVCISSTVCRCSGRWSRNTSLDEANQEIDQDPEEVVVRTSRSCGAAECNTFCRKLGYARGVCIGTYCQCRARAASDVLRPEIENPSDGDDNARSAFLNAINPEIDNLYDEATLESSTRKCVNSQCRSACRRRGFTRGVCVGINVCRCSGRVFRATEEAATLDDVSQEIENVRDGGETLDRSVRSCVNSQCNSVCRRLGFARGVCISSTVCRCSGRLAKANDEDASLDSVNQETENDYDGTDTLDRSVRSCVNSQCNSVCRALGFARGVCISSTVCRCSGRLAKKNDEDASLDSVNQETENDYDGTDTLDRSVRSCVNSQCNSVCRALGFARGVCISSTVCRCSGRLAKANDEDASLDSVNQETENDYDGTDTLDRSVRSCVNSQCNSVCRALGFARGVCISSTVCRCSGRLAKTSEEAASPTDVYQAETENDYDGTDTLDRSVRSCVNSQCNSVCRRLGFARGVCISSTVCRCSGRLAKTSEEAASLADVYQETENDYDGTDTLDRSVRSCVNSQCNSVCRALGFARGVCISSTVCRCSGRLAKANDEDASLDSVNQETENGYDGTDTLDRSVRSCVNSQCNSVCRRLGFARGVCISSTVCRCSGRLAKATEEASSIEDVNQEIENFNDGVDTLDRFVRSCVNSQCNSVCRRLGFTRGVCISSTVCRCSGRRAQDVFPDANTIQDVSADAGPGNVNPPVYKEESNDIPQN